MILVPRRFAPTGDRFAPEQVIGLPPERVIGFTGMRMLLARAATTCRRRAWDGQRVGVARHGRGGRHRRSG